jgi:sarcosine oxidase subunit gamma
LVLRGEIDVVGEPFAGVTGLALPRACRGTARAPGLGVLWLAPDEWLLMTPDVEAAPGLERRLRAALADRHHQLVDVSDYYVAIEASGPALRSCLAKVVALDLHPRAWRRDEVLGTLLAKAVVQLWLVADEADADGPAARIVVRRSLADYVWCLLVEAGREWGLAPATPVGRVPLHVPDADGAGRARA